MKGSTRTKSALEQAHAKVHQKDKREFFGQSYTYNLGALAGVRVIGVIQTASGGCFVGWHAQSGISVRLDTDLLPVTKDPEELQVMLDDWAEKLGLYQGPLAGGVS